jgi:hypothetical protein
MVHDYARQRGIQAALGECIGELKRLTPVERGYALIGAGRRGEGENERKKNIAAYCDHGPKLSVIAGLDPAIHHLRMKMDARVKPGHDNSTSALVFIAIIHEDGDEDHEIQNDDTCYRRRIGRDFIRAACAGAR